MKLVGMLFQMFGLFFGTILLAFIMSFIIAIPAMLLWNWIMVGKFAAPEFGYWEMVGLMFLVRIIVPSPVNRNVKKDQKDSKESFRTK